MKRIVHYSLVTLCVLCLNLNSDIAHAQTAPIAIEDFDIGKAALKGKIIDADGHPIPDATVRLIGGTTASDLGYLSKGSITAKPGLSGGFQLDLDSHFSYFGNSLSRKPNLIVWAKGYAFHTEPVPLSRFLVDSSIEIKMAPTDPFSVQIIDSTGNPLSGISVRPAKIADQTIPYDDAIEMIALSNQEGMAHFELIEGANLKAVYLFGPEIGNQYVTLEQDEDQWIARALETVKVETTISAKESDLYESPDLSSIKLQLISKADDSGTSYTWDDVEVDASGIAETATLCNGIRTARSFLPTDLPYTFDRVNAYTNLTPDGNSIQLKLLPATLVKGRIIDAETGAGIQSIDIDYFDSTGRPTTTDRNGDFQYWAGPNRIEYFPTDPFGRFNLAGAFYLTPQILPTDGVLQLKPVQLQPMSRGSGRVVDESGAPIANAIIDCSFKRERFSMTTQLHSDRKGYFHFFGVNEGDTVSLSMKNQSTGTEQPVSLRLQSDSTPLLRVVDLPTVRFAGRVVDSQGQPVTNASVVVRQALVHAEESYSGEDRLISPMYGSETIMTDEDGMFQTPRTTDFNQDTSVLITSKGHQTYASGWKKRLPPNADIGLVDVGELSLLDLPLTKNLDVKVVDEQTGRPIEDARIVFLGAKSGHVKSNVTSRAPTQLLLKDGPQIIAGAADGYAPKIQAVQSLPVNSIEIRLEKIGSHTATHTPVGLSRQQIRRFTDQLISLVPKPEPKDTDYRQAMYYSSLVLTDMPGILERFQQIEGIESQLNLLSVLSIQMKAIPLEALKQILSSIDDRFKNRIFISLVERASTISEKEELLAEALITVRQLSGDEQLYEYSQLVNALLNSGMSSIAKEILVEAWDRHPELQQWIDRGERLGPQGLKPGIARTFAPAYALVDPSQASKLIELSAYSSEIEMLQATALMYLVHQNQDQWESRLRDLTNSEAFAIGAFRFCERVEFKDVDSGIKLAEAMPNSVSKLQFLLHVAEKSNADLKQRIQLAELGLETLQNSQGYGQWSQFASKGCTLVAPWDSELAEQYAFESLWLCENETMLMPFNLTCELAISLAPFDESLARILVEPCFEDWSWVFEEHDRSSLYRRNQPLIAAAHIDPDWAVTKTKELLSTELSEKLSHQYATIYGIVSQLSNRYVDLSR